MEPVTDKKKPANNEREQRLAAALRENLRRRKAQARGINSSAPAQAGAQTGEADER